MKKTLIITAILLSGIYVHSQDRVFYYHKGEKIYLDKVENTQIIHFKKTAERQQKDNICRQLQMSKHTVAEITPYMYRVSGTAERKAAVIASIAAAGSNNIQYISDMFMANDSSVQWLSNKISVKIYPESDLSELLQRYNIPFTDFRQIGSDRHTYMVDLDVAENNAMEYANRLSETGSVVWTQPSFLKLIRKYNTDYHLQWGLNNTGQWGSLMDPDQNADSTGIDINAVKAWDIATGAGVKVAVIDEGVDLTYPDLADNLLPGYDATDGRDGAVNGGYGGMSDCGYKDSHGTLCAGVIAAADNNIGIKGVAYDAQIIPIRIGYKFTDPLNGGCDQDDWLWDEEIYVDALKKAWLDYEADILSCSWGGISQSEALEQEIDAAVTQGRNSLGCIVVFATGNHELSYVNHTVYYPAYLSNVIAVGAMSPCGEWKNHNSCDGEEWGSGYGAELDLVAPGVLIRTTTIGDEYATFSGTSAACPHVAGVAALVLSANPGLTGQEVRHIMESTARKVNQYDSSTNPDGYEYTYNPSAHPNGTWNEKTGYGLIDAFAAVQEATCIDTLTYEAFYSDAWYTGYVHGCDTLIIQDIEMSAYHSQMHVTAGKQIIIKPGTYIEAPPGTSLVIGVRDSPENASSSAQSVRAERAVTDFTVEKPDEPKPEDNTADLPGNSFDFSILPNPNDGNFTLKLNSHEAGQPYMVEIFNSSGVLQSTTAGSVNNLNINRSDLPDGIYFVKVSMENSNITKRLILKK